MEKLQELARFLGGQIEQLNKTRASSLQITPLDFEPFSSDCCGAEIKWSTICTECGEHCEPFESEE